MQLRFPELPARKCTKIMNLYFMLQILAKVQNPLKLLLLKVTSEDGISKSLKPCEAALIKGDREACHVQPAKIATSENGF